MELFSIVGLALTCAVLCILIKQYKPEYAMLVSLACGLGLFLIILVRMSPVFDTIRELVTKADLNQEYLTVLLKALGLCYVTQLACDTCTDAGQASIAAKVDLAGKVAVLLVSLPLFSSLADLAIRLISQ